MAENFDAQVMESVRSLFELTSRIDERVKQLADSANRADEKFDSAMKAHNELLGRVVRLESVNSEKQGEEINEMRKKIFEFENKINSMEIVVSQSQNRWDRIMDYVKDFLVAIAAAFIIWKMGLGG